MAPNPNAGTINFYRMPRTPGTQPAPVVQDSGPFKTSRTPAVGLRIPEQPSEFAAAAANAAQNNADARRRAAPPSLPPGPPNAPQKPDLRQPFASDAGIPPPTMFGAGLPARTQTPAPARPSRDDRFVANMMAAQEELDRQTASGPTPTPTAPKQPARTPEQTHQDIVNNPTQIGTLTDEQKAQAQANNAAAQADFNNRLRNMELPADMTPEKIYKTTMADGSTLLAGRGDPAKAKERDVLANAAKSGDMSGLSDLQQRQVAMLRDGGRFDQHGNIMTRQTQETLARATQDLRGGGSAPAAAGMPQVNQNWEAFKKAQAAGAFTKQRGETNRNYRARMNEMNATLGLDVSEVGNQRNNATSFANNQNSNETTRRGQDLSETQSLRSAQSAAAKAMQDQYNSDRQFGLNLSKEQRAAREAGDKEVLGRITSMLPTTGDPKRDGPMQARAMQRINQFMGQEQSRLKQALAENPNDEVSRQQLEALSTQGLSALAGREQELWQFMMGNQLRDTIAADASWWNPFKGENTSDKPVAPGEAKWQKGVFRDYVRLPDGSHVPASQVTNDQAEALGIRIPGR